ncbi:MAG TPA: class I SAM-dependent methyltransferase [Pyrinomonadaceae bacterium]|jgi:SAM-dependent methyltransferase|nr:class I SAM-dependent methyltransferase [Pyrinomonadaceae bacterium]
MGIIGGELGYKLLRQAARVSPGNELTTAYDNRSKMEVFFGPDIWKELADKTVVDFGCENGVEAIDMAEHGVRRVIGVDIREGPLAVARRAAQAKGLSDRCTFATTIDEKVDVVVSLDAFEHFADPLAMLGVMRKLLKDDGYILTCFGPTWYHPLGGHGFSIFPWAHLVFTENTFMRSYRDGSGDDARRFGEVSGGLNQLTIRRFEKIVAQSDFEFVSFKAVPIRRLSLISNYLTREFTTAVVRCKLAPRRRQQS